MKTFNTFLKEQRQDLIKSWYHPETKREVIVHQSPIGFRGGDIDSHSNHLFNNHELYGYSKIEDIFTQAGHEPEMAKQLSEKIALHSRANDGYVDWSDSLVHAMHKNGWVRVVKSNSEGEPHLYVGSHNQDLNAAAAKHLQNDGVTKAVSLARYNPRPTDSEIFQFEPPGRAVYKDYKVGN